MEEQRDKKKLIFCPHCRANESATFEVHSSSHLAFFLFIQHLTALYICRIFYFSKKNLKLPGQKMPYILLPSFPCVGRYFPMHFLNSCIEFLEQKHLQQIFVYGEIPEYLSCFFFLFVKNWFIFQGNKLRHVFSFTPLRSLLTFQ